MNPNPAPTPASGEALRVAVVAVHGIADQLRGDTGRAVALQLAAACQGSVQSFDLPLHAGPLDPAAPYQRLDPGAWRHRGMKSLRQSWRSDFLDDDIGGLPSAPGAPPRRNSAGARAADAAGSGAAAGQPPHRPTADTGVRFTDYLLAKAQGRRRGAGEPVNVAVNEVRGAQLQADVYEMYWADLSRLPGSVMRIVAELFTLLFHLSRLGMDELALAGHLAGGRPLRALVGVQRCADWLFSRVLALLALQLLVCVLVLLPALLPSAHGAAFKGVAALLMGLGIAAVGVYGRGWRWRVALPAGALAVVVVALLLRTAYGGFMLMMVWLALLALAYLAFLNYCEQRFRAVLGVGMVLGLVTLVGVLWHGSAAGAGLLLHKQGWLNGALGAFEGALQLQAIAWSVLAALVAASVVLSEWVIWRHREGPDHRQTLGTARLGLFASVGAFALCLMVAFVFTQWALKGALSGLPYTPWLFVAAAGAEPDAATFLAQSASRSSGSFALVALLMLAMVGFVALVFVPSVLRELRLAGEPVAGALGRWLSTGYRSIERLVRLWGPAVAVVALGVSAALVLAALQRLDITPPWPGFTAFMGRADKNVQALSDSWLASLLMVVAGGAAGLLALGKVAVKQLKAIRAPLDAALDVDNHFREFPRHAISRVRIVQRYVALLEHLRQQGYERVVIVAHSQGTVITAELLRYLQQRERLAEPGAASTPGQVDMQRLRGWLDASGLRLLTVGSPLRQLYALRFPSLYPWVLAAVTHSSGQTWSGPQPHALGLQRWANVWGSGDYVGRWLWSANDGTSPAPLQVDDARYGGAVHEGQDAAGRGWRDRCLGADAHTHYFDLDQPAVAAELLALVRP